MDTFDIPTPINYLGSTSVGKSIATVGNRTDPWVLPSCHEPEVPLAVVEVAYQSIVNITVDPILVPPIVSEEPKESYLLAWVEMSFYTDDCLDMVFPSDESSLEAISRKDKVCEDLHHISYFLP